MRPVRFLDACVWFRDVTSFSDASGMVCIRVEPVSIMTHQTYCSDSLLLERRPYQTHQKRTWCHEIRRMCPKNAHDACRVNTALGYEIGAEWLICSAFYPSRFMPGELVITRGEHGQDQDWISCRILAIFLDQDWIWIFIFEKNWIKTGSGYLFDFYSEIFLRVIQNVTNDDGAVVFFAIMIFIFTKNQNDFVSVCCTHHNRW